MKLLHIGKKGNVERYTAAERFTESFELVDIPMGLSDEEILKAGGDADFIIADAMGTLSAGVIENMPNLKLIHSEGVGFNFFDIEAAKKRNIPVCSCKGMNAMAVAEQTILLMLGLLRSVKQGDTDVREGRQIITKENYMKEGNLFELADFKIGLLGFGDIGKSVAKLTAAFGAETYFYNTSGADKKTEEEYKAKYLPLDELLSKCNMISIHLPVTEKTRHMANDEFFAKMRDGSYIVNTSRGEIVDSGALIRAIKSGKIAGAGLDTVEGEPVQKDNILLSMDKAASGKILFSPHIGGVTASSFKRGYAMAWENIRRICEGLEPVRVVSR
ncbi:MAG: NAD(P)-binding domain-containing protein [Clostridiales bacterium]|nr:NAD(P)-binding domain-containing protein [Clostridiales bacterium]